MISLWVCSACNISHSGPLGRRCGATVCSSAAMVEAFPEEQASNGSLNISQEVIDKTTAQLVENPSLLDSIGSSVIDIPVTSVQTVSNASSNKGKGNSVAGVNDPILSALQNISSQFQVFQQQAAIDRARVGELFEQFTNSQNVVKKQKTPHKKNGKKQTDVVVDNDVV